MSSVSKGPFARRGYTHTSEAAAGAAVALLPDVTERRVKVLPPAPAAAVVECAVVLRIVEKLTPANADAVKTKLLKILGAA